MSPNKQIKPKDKPETELTSRITELEQELSLKNKEIEELKAKLSDKEEDLSSKNKEIEELKTKLSDKKEDLSSKNKEIEDEDLYKPIQLLNSEFIKNLEKVEEISFGSSGKVFKVAKREFYALKVLKKKVAHKEFKQLLNEYEIMNSLSHLNILKTFGLHMSDNEEPPSILLELCDTNLEEKVTKNTLSSVDIAFTIYQIAEGMKYVHFLKIIHRDLKPSNILVASDGTIKIADFGLSKIMTIEEQSMTGGVGTQKFMAPEVIDELEYDEKVDVYSFGVLVFFILSGGQLPDIKMSEKMKGKKAPIPSSFTKFSQELISECWNFNSADRPSFSDIVEKMVQNDFKLVDLDSSENELVKNKVEQHKSKIPKY